tara:strand:+ start:478 stop:1128 length:651 start_codon:yes stop_codon:yes gene_type:complete
MGDTRYEKVWEQMQLLGIEDVTSKRQAKNGTRVWRLPIKNNHKPTSFIEVASFKTGYVRNQNGGYTNYQLNKRNFTEDYYPEHEINDDYTYGKKTGKYIKFKTRGCVLIPIEIDRLEYLISYCLKNYFIKRANQVVEGKYVSQWYHDWSLERANETYSENTGAMARINDMEEKLEAMTEARDYYLNKTHSLKNKLDDAGLLQNLSVTVNGERYKII